MKRYYHFLLPLCLLVILFICLPVSGMSQVGDPCTDPDIPCPIDGGITALLVVGVGYGIRKVWQARKY